MYMGLERLQCFYIGERVVYMGVKRVLLGEEAVHHVKRVYIAKSTRSPCKWRFRWDHEPFPM